MLAVIECNSGVRGQLEAALSWVEVSLYFIHQYCRVSRQREATNFLLNVVQ